MVFAIDFGLADEFVSPHTGRHIGLERGGCFTGTVEYASLHAHAGLTLSRRDDLEAAGYMFIALLRGSLPWEHSGSSCATEDAWFHHCYKEKARLPLGTVCHGCPPEFRQYLTYCRNLKFKETPDYRYLHGLLLTVFEREAFVDDGTLDLPTFDD